MQSDIIIPKKAIQHGFGLKPPKLEIPYVNSHKNPPKPASGELVTKPLKPGIKYVIDHKNTSNHPLAYNQLEKYPNARCYPQFS